MPELTLYWSWHAGSRALVYLLANHKRPTAFNCCLPLTDYSSVGGGNDLLGARGQFHSSLFGLRVVGDDSGIVARGSGQLAPVARLFLQTAYDGPLGHGSHREHIANVQLSCEGKRHAAVRGPKWYLDNCEPEATQMHSLCTAPKTQPRPTALSAPRWIRSAQQGSPGEVSSWVSSLPLLSASLLVRLSPHSTDFPSWVRGLPFLPQYTNCPVWMPSAAMNSSVRFLNRYGSRKTTLARGAPRPGSWMISCGPRRRERGVPGGRLIPPPAADRAPYLHDALDVAVPLGEVHGAQTRGSFAVLHVRAEHGAGALPLPTDHAAHGGSLGAAHCQRPGGPSPPAARLQGPLSPGSSLQSLVPSAAPSPAVRLGVLSGVRLGPSETPGRRMAVDGTGTAATKSRLTCCLARPKEKTRRPRASLSSGAGPKPLDLPGRRRGRERSARRDL